MLRNLLLCLTIIMFVTSSSSFSGIFYVPNDTTSIQGGIHLSGNGDTVLVSDGTYYENINFKGKAITVASLFIMDGDTNHINNTIIDGSQPSHPDSGSVVRFVSGEDTTSVLCGFTIIGGTGDKIHVPALGQYIIQGGGINLFESSGKIINNKISNNIIYSNQYSVCGGGISAGTAEPQNEYVYIGNNIINSNSITGPYAEGGGIYVSWINTQYIIENNKINYNIVTALSSWMARGGGILSEHVLPSNGDMIIRNNIIKGNELHGVRSFGGGIHVFYWEYSPVVDQQPNPIIFNNIITDNYSSYLGGGLTVWRFNPNTILPSPGAGITAQPSIINNTVVNNSAQHGYGIFIMNSVPFFMNNIMWNTPLSAGGGEIFLGNFSGGGTVWNNLYGDIEMYHSDIRDTAWVDSTKGIFNADPLFADTINYELSDSSPCIGAGIDSIEIGGIWYTVPTTCYLGHPRPSPPGSNPDIGACESSLAVSGLERRSDNISRTFQLYQNYPNPFNPSTTIIFDLQKKSKVSLKIFNIIGKEVTTLVADKLSAGSYSYDWDAGHLASGVYLYRLEAEGFVQTHKMILIR
ncbi:MAG: T9SS type A sorting domain-containing protein [Calditrichaeota bacterium]|nr:T9SS type A sorting domain-containing protein [Calditrichota bacterium]